MTLKSDQNLVIDGYEVSYLLIRSRKRKRSLSMQLKNSGVLQLNVPYATSKKDIESFIVAKYDWVKKKQQNRESRKASKPLAYKNGEQHWYLGKQLKLELVTEKQTKVEIVADKLFIFHRKNSSIKNILNKWYHRRALEYFTARTELFANSYQFPRIKSVKVRRMKARWGSCSSDAVITYNVHLIKANPESIDYVVIHELCHLLHPNHGKKFYQLQSKINPSWKPQKQILNQLGYKYISNPDSEK